MTPLMQRAFTLLLSSIVLWVATGCSTTLHMRSGVDLVGDIERADDQYVYVVLDELTDLAKHQERMAQAEPKLGAEGERGDNRRLFRVRRDQVKSMAFPGLALGITGTVLQALGFGMALVGGATAGSCSGELCGLLPFIALSAPGLTVGGAGTAMMISGWTVYANARADSDPAPRPKRVSLQPFAAPVDDGGATGGVRAALSW